ncbi:MULTISPECIES: FtsL-like putative cell division protein [Amniculibacterium]|uniref:FtsL-like putative cell division protein n=1 Tax=Amniculibacterium TaxID=2715289 RepID=UPI000F59BE7A|nr:MULTISPECIES: FtsL-like putative cell division protein [Amniculibacterium]
MAKKNTYKPQKKLTFVDIIKGNFLNRDEVTIHYKFYLLLFVLMIIMIYSNHLVSQKIELVNDLKDKTEEYKSRNAYAQSNLIKVRMESELSKEMVSDSLMSLERHPHKLLIKLDSTEIHGSAE